jgi:hypothetical protein
MVDRRIDQPMFGLGNQPNRPHHLLLCWLAAAEPVAGEGMPIPPDVPTSSRRLAAEPGGGLGIFKTCEPSGRGRSSALHRVARPSHSTRRVLRLTPRLG